MRARSAYALLTAAMLSLALTWPSAAPASAGRNGDLLFAKQRYAQPTRLNDIYAIRPGSASARRDDHPAWSPDGSRILFERSGGWVDPAPLFVMRPDGSDQHQVGTLAGRMPTWSPDGRRIAYVRYGSETNPSGDPPEILRANADGTDVQLVTRLGSGWVLKFQSRIDWRVR